MLRIAFFGVGSWHSFRRSKGTRDRRAAAVGQMPPLGARLRLPLLLLAPLAQPSQTVGLQQPDCDVLMHGARGDGSTDDGAAIQHAIAACAGETGGAVLLRAPRVFASSPLELPSHTTLRIEAGATLTAVLRVEQWPNSTHGETCSVNYDEANTVLRPQLANFIWSGNSTDITITGGGKIDGRGSRWWHGNVTKEPWWHTCRPGLVAGRNLTRFAMHDIILQDSPRFVICTHGLNGATFTNVTIDSAGGKNTDGFHIQGRDVYIGQSSVTNGDDCVPISGNSRNVTIEDVSCHSGNGLVPIIWAHHHEWSGAQTTDGHGVIEDIVFRRVKLLSTGTGIAVKSLGKFVGTVRNVLWEDVEMTGTRGAAIMVNMFGQNSGLAAAGPDDNARAMPVGGDARAGAAAGSGMMQVHNLTIRNVRVAGAEHAGKLMCGNGTDACSGIVMENVSMVGCGSGWECGGEVVGTSGDCVPKPCF